MQAERFRRPGFRPSSRNKQYDLNYIGHDELLCFARGEITDSAELRWYREAEGFMLVMRK